MKHLRDSGMDIHVKLHRDTRSIEEFLESKKTEDADKGGRIYINYEEAYDSDEEDNEEDYVTDDEGEDEG